MNLGQLLLAAKQKVIFNLNVSILNFTDPFCVHN